MRSLALLILGLTLIGTLNRSAGSIQSEASAGPIALQLFLGGSGLSAFGALSTALDRTNAWYLLQTPLLPRQLWRRVVLQTVSTNGALLLPLTAITVWKISDHGILWMVGGVAWLVAGCILGAILIVQLWAARTHLLSRALLPIVPAIIALVVMAERVGAFDAVPTAIALIDPLLIIAVGIGAGANVFGRWYIRTAQELVNNAVPQRSWLGPLPEWLDNRMVVDASPTLAIAVRDIALQARDGFFLIRYALVIAAGPLWLLLGSYVRDDSTLLAVLLLVGCYAYGEITPSPIGMEGARFIQTWLTPVQPRQIFLGKLIGNTTINLVQVLIAAITINIVGGDIERPLILALAITGIAGIIVTAMSAFDLDLRLHLSSPVQALIIEHLPFRPWRIAAMLIATAAGTLLLSAVRFAHPALAIALCGLIIGIVTWMGYRQLTSLMSKPPLRS